MKEKKKFMNKTKVEKKSFKKLVSGWKQDKFVAGSNATGFKLQMENVNDLVKVEGTEVTAELSLTVSLWLYFFLFFFFLKKGKVNTLL